MASKVRGFPIEDLEVFEKNGEWRATLSLDRSSRGHKELHMDCWSENGLKWFHQKDGTPVHSVYERVLAGKVRLIKRDRRARGGQRGHDKTQH